MAALVRSGPDRAEHGVVRWRRVDLAAVIEARFEVRLAERTVGTLLRRLGFERLLVRPRHPAHDPEAQSAHKKLCRAGRGRDPGARPRQADRALVAGRGPRRQARHPDARLADKRSRPPALRDQRYRWAYLFGAVCPARGVGAGLVLPAANGHEMEEYLAEISRQVAPGAHAVVTLYGAG